MAEGLLTPGQLRGPLVRRLFYDVYTPAFVKVTHPLRCRGAALILPSEATLTGRSAAAVRGVDLPGAWDPVEVLAPLTLRVTRRTGILLRRTELAAADRSPWRDIGIASPRRMTLDLLLDRRLAPSVADLDVVLRTGLITLEEIEAYAQAQHVRGVVQARTAVALADPRAESPPESMTRVYLALAGLFPEPQVWISNESGRIAQVDLAFEGLKIAIEYDGQWKSSLWSLNRDRNRLNAVRAAGWEVVFITAEHLRDPAQIVALVRAALMKRAAA